MGESCKCCAQPRSWREMVSASDFKFEISVLRSVNTPIRSITPNIERTPPTEPRAMYRNVRSSGVVPRSNPSAILFETESAARSIDLASCDGAAAALSLPERKCARQAQRQLAKQEGPQGENISQCTQPRMLIRLDPVNHFMPSTETKQEIYSLSFGIFTKSTMPTIVASVGGSAGRNGKLASLPRHQ